MPIFKELNKQVSLQDQLQSNEDGSVVLINVFTIDPDDEDDLIVCWSHDADFMKAQPGYISTQLHKAIGGSSTYVNYAIWESLYSFKKAFLHPEFQKRIARYPDSAIVSPHLFKKFTVANHCMS